MQNSNKNLFSFISAGCFGIFVLIRIYYTIQAMIEGYFTFSGYWRALLFILGIFIIAVSAVLDERIITIVGLGICTFVKLVAVFVELKYIFVDFSNFFYFIFSDLLGLFVFGLPLICTILNNKYKNISFIGGGVINLISYLLCSILFYLIYWVIINGGSFYFSFISFLYTLLISVGLIAYGLSIEK